LEPGVYDLVATDWQGVTALSLNEMRSKLVFLEIASIRGVVSQNTPLLRKFRTEFREVGIEDENDQVS